MGLLVAPLIGLHGEHAEEGKKLDSLVDKSSYLIHGRPDVLEAGPQIQRLLQDDVSSRCSNWTSPGICPWLAKTAGLQVHNSAARHCGQKLWAGVLKAGMRS